MKEFFKKLWEKIKALALKVWEMIKTWAVKRAWPWLKKNWMQLINMVVLFIVSGNLEKSPLKLLVGTWFAVLIAYYIFWKFLGVERMFAPQPEPPAPVPVDPIVPPVTPDLNPQPEPPKPEVVVEAPAKVKRAPKKKI